MMGQDKIQPANKEEKQQFRVKIIVYADGEHRLFPSLTTFAVTWHISTHYTRLKGYSTTCPSQGKR